MTRIGSDGERDIIDTYFRCRVFSDLTGDFVTEHVKEAWGKIVTSFEEFTQRGSGWVLESIQNLEVNVAVYRPLGGNSYVPLPRHLEEKKALLNIQNSDEKCFLWCVIAHQLGLDNNDNPNRVSHYQPLEHTLKTDNIPFPVPISKVPLFEKLNNLRINIFGYESHETFPLYISNREDPNCINLLLISDEEGTQHYCLIRDMSRLVGNLSKHRAATFVCYRCLHRFTAQRILDEHTPYCQEHTPQHVKLPSLKESTLQFTSHHFRQALPFIIYADFETIISPIPTAQPSTSESYTLNTAEHVPCGYAYIIIGPNGESIKPPTVYRGPNAVDHFINSIIAEKDSLVPDLIGIKPLRMRPQDIVHFNNSLSCNFCQKTFTEGDKCRDHDHLTGLYRQALCKKCNFSFRLMKTIPVVFHNLKNYDAHLIMQGIGKVRDHEYHVIATNMEKYISFSISRKHEEVSVSLRFIDSFQFLGTSLEKLVSNLNPADFKILNAHMPQHTNLLLRKGVYPYEYMDSFQKFDEPSLPPQQAFFSSLTGESISEEDYCHAQIVWNTFNIQNLGEYHDLYVKSDVLLLSDVFQSFRSLCKSYYDLDPAHLVTAPGLAWQASLKMSQQPLQLFTDMGMHLLIEKGIRGGVAMISKRWARANNKYLEDYDPALPSTYIMYLDANNLYGWGMSQPLPYGNFEWIAPDQFDQTLILSTPDDSDVGYIVECDLEYPAHLHESHNDYPLAPEKIQITLDMLSPHALELLGGSGFTKSTKLAPNLNDKKHYVTYYRNLKLYLALGLKLAKIHKVLKFSQRPWLQNYIDFNTRHRKNATNSFQKDFFKLLCNSVYGKLMEDVRRRVDVQLVNCSEKAQKLVAAPTFHAFRSFSEDLKGVERVKKSIVLNRPIYAGFIILELSKLHMYNFHYNHIKQTYGDRARLLFTDTDSLTYEIETEDFYSDMSLKLNLYDTSDYPNTHKLYSTVNKKKIGCFKDELNGKPVIEFVGLRAKMYSLITSDEEKKTAKGVARSIIKKQLNHHNYKDTLLHGHTSRAVQTRITHFNHKLYTTNINKITLSPFDDKRYLLDDSVHSLSYGHSLIPPP